MSGVGKALKKVGKVTKKVAKAPVKVTGKAVKGTAKVTKKTVKGAAKVTAKTGKGTFKATKFVAKNPVTRGVARAGLAASTGGASEAAFATASVARNPKKGLKGLVKKSLSVATGGASDAAYATAHKVKKVKTIAKVVRNPKKAAQAKAQSRASRYQDSLQQRANESASNLFSGGNMSKPDFGQGSNFNEMGAADFGGIGGPVDAEMMDDPITIGGVMKFGPHGVFAKRKLASTKKKKAAARKSSQMSGADFGVSADFGSQSNYRNGGADFNGADFGYSQEDGEMQDEPISIGSADFGAPQDPRPPTATPQQIAKSDKIRAIKAVRALDLVQSIAYAKDESNPPGLRRLAKRRASKLYLKTQGLGLAQADFGSNNDITDYGAADFGMARGMGYDVSSMEGIVEARDAGFHDTINGSRPGIDDEFGFSFSSLASNAKAIGKQALAVGFKSTQGSALQQTSDKLSQNPNAKAFVQETAAAAFEEGKSSFFKEYGMKILAGSLVVAALGIYVAKKK